MNLHVLLSCSADSTQKDGSSNKQQKIDDDNTDANVESMAKRHIEADLSIPATEKFTYHIYKAHLDGDDKIDAIITVNRLEFARQKAAQSENTAKRAEIGYMGNYNYIFYFDGGLNQISPNIPIPSSPMAELTVIFEHVTSDAFKDAIVEFRILNASYRDYYTITNHTPRRIFQWKNFEGINSDTKEAFCFSYDTGTMGPSRDIIVKKARFTQKESATDIYSYKPNLVPTNEIVYRFFYHPKQGKYVTNR
jgi:hypothetical protein